MSGAEISLVVGGLNDHRTPLMTISNVCSECGEISRRTIDANDYLLLPDGAEALAVEDANRALTHLWLVHGITGEVAS